MKFMVRFAVALLLLFHVGSDATAQTPRALPPGKLPDDTRLSGLRTLGDYFPFTPVVSKEAWEKRAESLRRQVRVATGVWPLPAERPALNAQVFGKIERDDYTVEKVILESFPGHYVTGNLYRPKGKSGKLPAVLNPHGHWPNGRFMELSEAEVRKQISIGAERFEISGRYPLQARPVQLARMGSIAFFYDMEGYADSIQLTDPQGAITHRPGVRESMNTMQNWGFSSPQGELQLLTHMALQTWNSIRVLDFITSLPDVDPAKIAITGASGGGTQSFILSAVDERVAVSVPAVMVSTAMQGGCTCENAPYLRIGAGNVDIAALTAPRPLAMIGANDWTKEILSKGYPELKNLYTMLGAQAHVHAEAFTHFEHNYNAVSRSVMYTFLNKQFALGLPEPVIERDFQPLSKAELSVWDSQHPAPTGEKVGESHERALVKQMAEMSGRTIHALAPKDAATLAEFKRVVGGAWDVIIGRRLEDVGTVTFELKDKVARGENLQMTGLITREGQPASPLFSEASKHGREQLPVLLVHPKENWNGQVVIWIHESGKAGLFGADGAPLPEVTKLLDAKFSVLSADLLYQGEFTADGKPVTTQRVQAYGSGQEGWMQSAVYTFGYNPPLFAQRVQDVLTVIRFVQTDEHKAKSIHLVGLGNVAGPIAAAARAQSGAAVTKCAIDTGGFRFASLNKIADPMFVPGAVKYGDVPALLALNAPGQLWLGGESNEPMLVKNGYAASDQETSLLTAVQGADASTIVDWLKQ
jgi:hypothetical protein